MDETSFLNDQIARGKTVTIRLLEGRDIVAMIVAQDAASVIVRRQNPQMNAQAEHSLIYKKAISIITPL